MESGMNDQKVLKGIKILVPVVGIGIVLTVVTFAIAVTTLVRVNKGFSDVQGSVVGTTSSTTVRPTNPSVTTTSLPGQTTSTATTTTTGAPSEAVLPKEIHIQEVMDHLSELQRIATDENGNRAINTQGFNRTLDYIVSTLRNRTNYNVTTRFFPVKAFNLDSDPVFTSSIDGVATNYTYANDSTSDFLVPKYSTSAVYAEELQLTAIPNLGCDDEDWRQAIPPPNGRAVLVKRGNCTFVQKADFATMYNASALLIYNSGNSPDNMRPVGINLDQNNTLPALSLSYAVGRNLNTSVLNSTNNVTVYLGISVRDEPPFPVGNICADTPTGDATQTILIGSHSDSVPEGPGINDNGSGSAANLGLAIALARLFQRSNYTAYRYRVRFCWWGAEEVGLLGSDYHVKQAENATEPGERLQDYLINLNYDMLGSPNFVFGIYDDQTANNDTPVQALPGSKKISDLFRRWFDEQKLPWSNSSFDGRSDYGPFLAKGIVAGGVSTGAEKNKSLDERNRYDAILGQGLGGLAGVPYDSCYHQACDSIHNINVFAYAKMVQAAAYVLEYLSQQNLQQWLYPNGRSAPASQPPTQRTYNSINEYFELPYL